MNAKTLHLLSEFYRTPWALLPATLQMARMVIERWASGEKLPEEEVRTIAESRPARSTREFEGMIAVLPIFGILGHRARLVKDISSGVGTSTELLALAFRAAVNDPNVSAIVFDVDSPGGSTFGADELASEIFAARGVKPIIASVNSMAASGAYWIASAADEVVITPGGVAGSIGVWTAHEDWSKFLDAKGVRVTLMSAGRYKVEGNAYGPLEDEARGAAQALVDKYYNLFVRAVRRNRGAEDLKAVREGYGEGRMLIAQDAVKEKLADRIATFDEVIGELQAKFAKMKEKRRYRTQDERALRIAAAR